ncbi:uncharacterized protein LDX57_000714 [Aspergillus melleus]|uniref:uncharacterized protein n=1 Tax=Aspergillus melleus TaxID=138277 RepID=UPI001E8DA70C|nr:uncharacterized protein LDX57_000714 [Aspergillus melleus]KAH8422958.1 hypothetical protein LDX57_000714 [Aspergillus melleus]
MRRVIRSRKSQQAGWGNQQQISGEGIYNGLHCEDAAHGYKTLKIGAVGHVEGVALGRDWARALEERSTKKRRVDGRGERREKKERARERERKSERERNRCKAQVERLGRTAFSRSKRD